MQLERRALEELGGENSPTTEPPRVLAWMRNPRKVPPAMLLSVTEETGHQLHIITEHTISVFTCISASRNVSKLCATATAVYFKCFNVDSVVTRVCLWVVCTVLGSQVATG